MSTDEADLGALYDNVRQRIALLVSNLGEPELTTTVRACPQWTVRDLLGHLTGVAEDGAAGTLRGPPGESTTADQVTARRGVPLDALLERWAEATPTFVARIQQRQVWPAVIDVLTHEHDIRGAVGQPGARESDEVRAVVPRLLRFDTPVPMVVRIGDEHYALGPPGEACLALDTGRFEALRWRMGRRSRRQMRAMRWSGNPSPVIDHLAVFAPTATDIIE